MGVARSRNYGAIARAVLANTFLSLLQHSRESVSVTGSFSRTSLLARTPIIVSTIVIALVSFGVGQT